jgi:hypothetical protein
MRSPGGYACVADPSPGLIKLDDPAARSEPAQQEYDTFSCGHCGNVRHVRVKERPEDIGGLCKQCMKLICPACVDTGRCDPLEKKLERMEKRDRALRSYGI